MANLTGTAGDDTMVGANGIKDTLIGGAGNDLILGYGSVAGGIGLPVPPFDPAGGGAADGDSLVGGLGNDALHGGGGNDTLVGDDGNDLLNGGTGSDKMAGGLGDDTYIVDSAADSITELPGGGTDSVNVSFTFKLSANLENLTLAGLANINGTGNAAANILYGNDGNNILSGGGDADTINGGAGSDKLDGGAGDDVMTGGDGDDIFIVDSALDQCSDFLGSALGGTDLVLSSVNYAIDNAIENLTLIGNKATEGKGNDLNNVIVGNGLANSLYGLVGNDTLNGAAGIDTLFGGKGDDVFIIDNKLEGVVENAGEGNDTIRWNLATALNLAAFAEIENATLLGSAGVALSGTVGNNKLEGNIGANKISGNGGSDTMVGGAGNDIYESDGGDVILELAGGGTDLLVSSADVLTLADNIEKLTIAGAAIFATGNGLKNVITGSAGNNSLDGGSDSGDTMIGGGGDDYYSVESGDMVVEDLAGGTDKVRWWGAGAYTLGANVENLELITAAVGIGNALDNRITGNAGNNTLDGRVGADVLIGENGDDIYIFDNVLDEAAEVGGQGIDEIRSSAALTAAFSEVEYYTFTGAGPVNFTANTLSNKVSGTAGADSFVGGAGDDTLDGKAGADWMAGGTGVDHYYVDNIKDKVDETSGDSVDTVWSTISFNLAANGTTVLGDLERLSLLGAGAINGTGNGFDNQIHGNSGANKLFGEGGNDGLYGEDGNDTLDGGQFDGEIDLLSGGDGNDLFILGAGDVASESFNGGIDTVMVDSDYELDPTVENLILGPNAHIGTGSNGVNNLIIGNDLANVIDGKLGKDTMVGGKGDDIYYIDRPDDVVTELAGGGNDTINANTASYTLPGQIENLTASGVANGNGLANLITGRDGNDTLDGKAGADTIDGGLGNDLLLVNSASDVAIGGGGIDEVRCSFTYTAGSGVENLTLTGNGAIHGTGNDLDNAIAGNSAGNKLTGGLGNDTLIGGGGSDTLDGGSGSDDFVCASGSGKDSILNFDFGAGGDQIDISSMLVGYIPGFSDVLDFVQIVVGAASTTIKVDANGLAGGSKFTDVAVIAATPPDIMSVNDIIVENLILS